MSTKLPIKPCEDVHCFYCGKLLPYYPDSVPPKHMRKTWDHKIPVCRGGTDDLDNLVLACEVCNRAKSFITIDEFRDLVRTLSAGFYGELSKQRFRFLPKWLRFAA
jgi:5-methylcytosine-specific restriction endonuclease McrA